MNIYAASTYYDSITDQLPCLKKEVKSTCGKAIRRIDRFTQLSLIGAQRCANQTNLPKTTGLYLTSVNGSLTNAFSVLKEIYVNKQAPMPLNFVNTVSNAACFYIAKQVGIKSHNMFVTRNDFGIESTLKLAQIDIENKNVDAALVGGVAQCAEPFSIHRKRLNLDDESMLAEGSHWYVIARQLEGAKPIASITLLREFTDINSLINHVDEIHFDGIIVGMGLGQEDEKIFSQAKPNMPVKHLYKSLGNYEFTTGHALTEIISSEPYHGGQWLHIDGNASGQIYAVGISRSA